MIGIFNFLASSLPGREQILSQFPLFPQLPPELRLKIWKHALPERVVEASLRFDNDSWVCSHSALPTHKLNNRPDPRRLPELFRVNVESRELCLKEYVKFSQTFVHPTLDFLYISWYWEPVSASMNVETKFYPVSGRPLATFQRVALTIGRNPAFDTRFGALVDCLQQLGTPKELLLSLVGPRLPSVQSVSTGFSISNGNVVALLDWPHKTDSNMAQEVRLQVMTAIENEQPSSYKMPDISQRLYYIYSGP